MTSCAEVRELLSAYVDGELPPDRSAEVADHLASCDACAREYEATLETVRTVREGLVRHRAPDVLRARVRAALREEAEREELNQPPRRDDDAAAARGRARRPRWRLSAVAAAAAAAVVIAAASSGLTLVAVGRRGAPSTPNGAI